MEEKRLGKKRGVKELGTARGEGTAYSCLYSTVKSPGIMYSTVKGRARGYALLKKRRKAKR